MSEDSGSVTVSEGFCYGGIVTNVQEGPNYLDDQEELQLMTEKARICRELGFRMWIYDEDKYPSGAARTKTVDAYDGTAVALDKTASGAVFTIGAGAAYILKK